MNYLNKSIIAIGVFTFISACEHHATSSQEGVATNAILAETVQGNASNISIGIVDGAPKFMGESSTVCHADGRCGMSSGISLTGISGDIDLSHFTPGDVTITISLGSDAYNAGYRFPSDVYQAVALVVIPEGATSTPDPVFGGPWPAEFGAPSVSADLRTLTFIDKDDDTETYEYSIAINGPGGRVILDPKVKNGGGRGNR